MTKELVWPFRMQRPEESSRHKTSKESCPHDEAMVYQDKKTILPSQLPPRRVVSEGDTAVIDRIYAYRSILSDKGSGSNHHKGTNTPPLLPPRRAISSNNTSNNTPRERSGDSTPKKPEAKMATLLQIALGIRIEIQLPESNTPSGPQTPFTPLSPEGLLNRGSGTVGHQQAKRKTIEGINYYCKLTVHEYKNPNKGSKRINTQHLEELLHNIQKQLYPEPDEYLEFFPEGNSHFLLEWRENAINLKQALNDPNFNPGNNKITGLATALMTKAWFADGDNKFDNILIVPDRHDPTRYLAFGIDGEQLTQGLGLDAKNLTDIYALLNNIKEIKQEQVPPTVKERLRSWIDPEEIRNFLKKIDANRSNLVETSKNYLKSGKSLEHALESIEDAVMEFQKSQPKKIAQTSYDCVEIETNPDAEKKENYRQIAESKNDSITRYSSYLEAISAPSSPKIR